MNTYGLFSIGASTLGPRPVNFSSTNLSEQSRNTLVTYLRVHNLTLNILGYIPGVSFFSGCTRMGLGCLGMILTLGLKKSQRSTINQGIVNEMLLTAISQVARGSLEALVPCGWIANCVFDIGATVLNTVNATDGSDIEYPLPLWFLYLA